MNFQGTDFSEILTALGVDYEQSEDAIQAEVLALFPNIGPGEMSGAELERIAMMRVFLAAHIIVSLPYNHGVPLMAGLLAIDDAYTFVRYFAKLVTSMWV